MSIVDYAKSELNLLYDKESLKDPMNKAIYKDIMALVKVFEKQGHSGFSASYLNSILHKLFKFQPLSPLTYNDGEWMEFTDGIWQNRRNGSIFTTDKKYWYDIDGLKLNRIERMFIKNRYGMALHKIKTENK